MLLSIDVPLQRRRRRRILLLRRHVFALSASIQLQEGLLRRRLSTYSPSVPSLYNFIPQLMSGDALDPIQYLSHYKSHTRFLAGPFEEVLGIENETPS